MIFKCTKCEKYSEANEFLETENYCEDCGSHSAVMCPKCDYAFDHVWNDEAYSEIMSLKDKK